MNDKKNEAGNLLPMTVTEGVTVNVLPNEAYEYVMTSKEVAHGYGVTDYSIRVTKLRHSDELIEGKHFITAVTICNTDLPKQLRCAHNAIMWTKRGIVRLGFFIKSERAKLFRDWAEELVIEKVEQHRQQTLFDVQRKQLPQKRLINRLDRNRMVRLLAMTARIEDSLLRNEIVNELVAGFDYGKGGQA